MHRGKKAAHALHYAGQESGRKAEQHYSERDDNIFNPAIRYATDNPLNPAQAFAMAPE